MVVVEKDDTSSQRHTDKSRIKTPPAKQAKMIFFCFRKRSEKEGGPSLSLSQVMMNSYQSSLPIQTENKKNMC